MIETELTFIDDKGKLYNKKCRAKVASLKVMRDVRLLDTEYTDKALELDKDGLFGKTQDEMSGMSLRQQLEYAKVAGAMEDLTQEKVLALARVVIDTTSWKESELNSFEEPITGDFWLSQSIPALTEFVNSFRSTVERTIPTN